MSWLSFVWSNLTRRKLRLVFTLLSIILAFLMFGMLDALRTSLSQAVNLTGADRLITISKVSIIDSFPVSHYEKVRAVQGVSSVVHLNWFGGVYKDGKAQIPVFSDQGGRVLQRVSGSEDHARGVRGLEGRSPGHGHRSGAGRYLRLEDR